MSVMQNDTFAVGATQINIGINSASVFPTLIKPDTSSWGGQLKIVGTGGTLQILPRAISGASVGGATNALSGYPLGATEVYSWQGPAAFYLQSSGATTTVAMILTYTSGATLA